MTAGGMENLELILEWPLTLQQVLTAAVAERQEKQPFALLKPAKRAAAAGIGELEMTRMQQSYR